MLPRLLSPGGEEIIWNLGPFSRNFMSEEDSVKRLSVMEVSPEARSGPVEECQIVLADDHAMVRHGIRRIIEERMDLRIVGEAADGLELMNLLKKVQPHLIILDIAMPHLRGLEAAREIKSLYPQIKVLILTMHKNEAYLKQALAVGCEGYLLKEDAGEKLIEALETIRNDEVFVSRLFSNEVIRNGKNAARSLGACPSAMG